MGCGASSPKSAVTSPERTSEKGEAKGDDSVTLLTRQEEDEAPSDASDAESASITPAAGRKRRSKRHQDVDMVVAVGERLSTQAGRKEGAGTAGERGDQSGSRSKSSDEEPAKGGPSNAATTSTTAKQQPEMQQLHRPQQSKSSAKELHVPEPIRDDSKNTSNRSPPTPSSDTNHTLDNLNAPVIIHPPTTTTSSLQKPPIPTPTTSPPQPPSPIPPPNQPTTPPPPPRRPQRPSPAFPSPPHTPPRQTFGTAFTSLFTRSTLQRDTPKPTSTTPSPSQTLKPPPKHQSHHRREPSTASTASSRSEDFTVDPPSHPDLLLSIESVSEMGDDEVIQPVHVQGGGGGRTWREEERVVGKSDGNGNGHMGWLPGAIGDDDEG
ncbi:hypothetical protein HDV00_004370 [Rhizophlyctis rosea]|nr:hypothetical protein HDV00_004370 [Rhizophlyctis rosea]